MKDVLTVCILGGIAAAYMCLPARTRSVPTPAPVPHHYSEPGVAYTTDYLSLRLPTGVVGISPGTQVAEHLDVSAADQQEVVSHGGYTFSVGPQMLTHDMDLARELAANDQRSQSHAALSLSRSQQQRADDQHTANLLSAQDVERANAQAVAASTVGTYASALHQPVAAVGASGGYGGTYHGGDTVINSSLTVIQYNNGVGAGSRGGSAGTISAGARTSRVAVPRSVPTRGMAGPAAPWPNTPGTGIAAPYAQ